MRTIKFLAIVTIEVEIIRSQGVNPVYDRPFASFVAGFFYVSQY